MNTILKQAIRNFRRLERTKAFVIVILSFYLGVFTEKSYTEWKRIKVNNYCLVNHERIKDFDDYYKFPRGLISRFSFESSYILISLAHEAQLTKCVEKNI